MGIELVIMNKNYLYEVQKLQKIAGLLREDEFDLGDNPLKLGNIEKLVKEVVSEIQNRDQKIKNSLAEVCEIVSGYIASTEKNLDEPYDTPGILSGHISDFGEDSGDYFETEEEMDEFEYIWYDIIMEKINKNDESFKSARDYVNFFDKLAEGLQR
jgi:hypothetical protein